MKPPGKLARPFHEAVRDEQLHDLEQLWYRAGDERGQFARQLLAPDANASARNTRSMSWRPSTNSPADTPMTVPEALEIKEELETIDKLLKQLEEAAKTAQIGIIDMEELSQFAEPGDIEQLDALQQQIQEYLRQMAEQQGLEEAQRGGFQMTPKAYRLFQSKLLTRIFEQLQASRSGRHQGPIVGEGATEMQQTKPYEFGDSVTHMDIPASFINALLARRPRLAGAPQDRRHRHPQDAQQPQVRLGGAARHERLDALRRPVHQRQAHGPGPRRPDPHRVSRRLPAVHRDVHLRQAAAHLGDRGADAQAGDDLRSRLCS